MAESDSDDELDNANAILSTNPPCALDSSAYRKQRRLAAWVATPALVEQELGQARATVSELRLTLKQLEAEEELWLEGFEAARAHINASLAGCRVRSGRLKSDAAHLYTLLAVESGVGVGSGLGRSRDEGMGVGAVSMSVSGGAYASATSTTTTAAAVTTTAGVVVGVGVGPCSISFTKGWSWRPINVPKLARPVS